MAFGLAVPIAALGGLIGLGGAEFRLPVLIGPLGHAHRRAVPLNLAVSLATIAAALAIRSRSLSLAPVAPLAHVLVALAAGAVVAAVAGAALLDRLSDERLGPGRCPTYRDRPVDRRRPRPYHPVGPERGSAGGRDRTHRARPPARPEAPCPALVVAAVEHADVWQAVLAVASPVKHPLDLTSSADDDHNDGEWTGERLLAMTSDERAALEQTVKVSGPRNG